jgi:hypothetical protein
MSSVRRTLSRESLKKLVEREYSPIITSLVFFIVFVACFMSAIGIVKAMNAYQVPIFLSGITFGILFALTLRASAKAALSLGPQHQDEKRKPSEEKDKF